MSEKVCKVFNVILKFALYGLLHHPVQIIYFASRKAFKKNVLIPSDPFYVIGYRGWQGLIAQGCHSSILIIDPKTAQTIQVLEKHKANVVKVSLHSKYVVSCLFVFDMITCISGIYLIHIHQLVIGRRWFDRWMWGEYCFLINEKTNYTLN